MQRKWPAPSFGSAPAYADQPSYLFNSMAALVLLFRSIRLRGGRLWSRAWLGVGFRRALLVLRGSAFALRLSCGLGRSRMALRWLGCRTARSRLGRGRLRGGFGARFLGGMSGRVSSSFTSRLAGVRSWFCGRACLAGMGLGWAGLTRPIRWRLCIFVLSFFWRCAIFCWMSCCCVICGLIFRGMTGRSVTSGSPIFRRMTRCCMVRGSLIFRRARSSRFLRRHLRSVVGSSCGLGGNHAATTEFTRFRGRRNRRTPVIFARE